MIHELFTENRSTIISVNSHFKIKIKFFWCTGEYSAVICASNSCKPSETSSASITSQKTDCMTSECALDKKLLHYFRESYHWMYLAYVR